MHLQNIKNRWMYVTNCLLCEKELHINKSKLHKVSFKCSSCYTTERNLKSKGITKYNFNKSFFKDINIISAYWAGFIAADEYISKDSRVCIKIK